MHFDFYIANLIDYLSIQKHYIQSHAQRETCQTFMIKVELFISENEACINTWSDRVFDQAYLPLTVLLLSRVNVKITKK